MPESLENSSAKSSAWLNPRARSFAGCIGIGIIAKFSLLYLGWYSKNFLCRSSANGPASSVRPRYFSSLTAFLTGFLYSPAQRICKTGASYFILHVRQILPVLLRKLQNTHPAPYLKDSFPHSEQKDSPDLPHPAHFLGAKISRAIFFNL